MPPDNNTPQESVVVTTRIGLSTSERLDRYLQFVNQREPGLNAKHSTVVRMLIVRGLEQVEKEHGPFPPVAKKRT
jgi:hypothetical protein